jgi:FMN-dependent NADH-azoreductase
MKFGLFVIARPSDSILSLSQAKANLNEERVMAKVLHIDSSSRSATSVTRILSKQFIDSWLQAHPADTVSYRDLVQEGMPYINEIAIAAMYTPEAGRTPEQREAYAGISKYVDEFAAADVYVLGVPMYNFNVPAIFKAYIDQIVVIGKTFGFSDKGLTPLLHGKKAIVLSSSGSSYDEPPMRDLDFHEPYLRAVLGFIGVKDVTFIKVRGHSEDVIKAEIEKAKSEILSAVQPSLQLVAH